MWWPNTNDLDRRHADERKENAFWSVTIPFYMYQCAALRGNDLHLTGIVCVLLSRSTDSDSWAPHTIVFGGSFTRQSEGEKTELLIEKKAKQFFLLPNRKTNPVVTRD